MEVRQRGQWRKDTTAKVGDDGATVVSYDRDGVGGPLMAVEGVRRPQGPDLCRVASDCLLPTDGTGAPARPNVLMFGDGDFTSDRIDEQEKRYMAWLDSLPPRCRLVVVEVGAGTAVPTIRFACQGLLGRWSMARKEGHATLVRINLDQSDVGSGGGERIAIGGMGALEALQKLDALVKARRSG